MNFSSYLILILIILGCTNENKSQSQRNLIKFQKVESIKLPLDAVTPANITSFQFFPEKGELSFLNIYSNSIYNYSIESESLVKIDTFDIEGPDGVGKFSNTTEFFIHNDTLFFYDRYSKQLSLINKNKTVLLQDNLGGKYKSTPYGMWGNWINPSSKGTYSMAGSAVSYSFFDVPKNADSLEFIYNPESKKLTKTYLPIPPEYIGHSWLTEVLRYYREYNVNTGEYLYSWPISDSLTVINDSEIKRIYMGSNIVKNIEELPSNKEALLTNIEEKFNFYYEQGNYSYLYYDKFRKLTFRIAFSGITEGMVDINDPYGNTENYQQNLIISDSNYRKIAEIPINQYSPNVVLVDKEGILLMKKPENEDFLIFDRFKIIHNSK